MSRVGGAAAERLRAALAVVLGGTTVLLVLSLLTTTSAPSAVMLAAVATTIAVAAGLSRISTTPVSSPLGLPARRSDPVPSLRAGCVTDAPRHPVRPRAPGLV